MSRLTFQFDPRGFFWLAETGEYRVIQRTFKGDTVRVIERQYTPLAVTREERDSIQSELTAIPPQLRAMAPEVPAVKAVFERIFVDPDGYLFIQMVGEPGDRGRLFDVLDPEGRYLGNIVSEVTFATSCVPVFLGDFVYGVTTDSLGVEYMVRARIERPE